METITELAEQSSDERREEIDCTRAGLADKLEALENRVMGTVEIAKDTVDTVKRTFDIKHHVEQHPWTVVGGCFLAGLALSVLLQKVGRQPRQTERETALSPSPARQAEQRGNGFVGAASLPPYQAPPPSPPGLFDLFHDDIVKVKGIAIGYVMGLARDAIKESVPDLAARIDDVMNSVTTKLGGEA